MRHLLTTVLLATLLTACGRPATPDGSPPTDAGRRTPSAAHPPAHTPATDRRGTEPTDSAQFPPENPIPKTELLAADRPRREPAGDAAQTEALVRGLNGFAFDLYRATAEESDGNLIYSPYSIAQAFSMVYAGARGRTEAQMADVLGFLVQEGHHPAANALDRHLAALGADAPPPAEEQGEAFALRNANAVWGQRGFPFEDAYLETLAAHYGAGVRTVDFAANPEGGRRVVNAWMKDRTEGRIPDVVPPGAITPDTRLVLANAIYFKAAWLHPFEEDGTKDGPFTLLDGSRVTVPMMHHSMARVPYAEGEGYQAVILPYTGETVDMVVVVPEAGRFAVVEDRLDTGFLAAVRADAAERDVTLTMPRFDFESELDLTRILPGMGMPDAFGAADFSGISRSEGLSISAAIHRATIAVDEKGTEATAATVIAMAESAMETARLTIDRPFIFAITDRETGAILFMGRVTNPAE